MEEQQRARLAEQITARREYKGWTEAKLAQESGVSIETISRLENAKTTNPRDHTIKSLAAAFNTTDDELAGPRLSPEAMDELAQTQLDRLEALLQENQRMMRDLLAFATERALGDALPPNGQPDAESEQDAGVSEGKA